MKTSTFEFYKKEILSFADDTRDVVVDRNGNITFMRFNQIMTVGIREDAKSHIVISYNGHDFPYKTFLAKHMASLDLMAQRILDNDPQQEDIYYVDGGAVLLTDDERNSEGTGLKLINHECTRPVPMGSKICFVTANAGHGKTHLLRRYQHEQARRYKNNESHFLFLHIDLHGRNLHGLDEMMLYEIHDRLHIPGIYTQSIMTLMRNGLLILGVDGFDELSAETDGEKAIGSFSNLIHSLDGQGTLIAASRRTFFNTQDYLKQKNLISDISEASCYFDELRLNNWGEKECVEYLSCFTNSPAEEYNKLLSYLGNDRNNPLIERPFLFTSIVDYAYSHDTTAYDFLREGNDSELGLERIISAFIRREVSKWNNYCLTDPNGYLSYEQHEEFLAEVAMEMWLSQRDYVNIEVLEFSLTIFLDSWGIPQNLHPDILNLVKSHALLVADNHGSQFRRFDHDEFRNYFLAKGVTALLESSCVSGNYNKVHRILSIGQMQDSVAMFSAKFIRRDLKLQVVKDLIRESNNELRNTYFQPNLGIFLPNFMDNEPLTERLTIDNRIVFSSLIFENKTLCNLRFVCCTFMNVSFHHTKMTNVSFHKCVFSDISFHKDSQMEFTNVVIHDDCQIAKVSVFDSNREPQYEEFAPLNINARLEKYNIRRDACNAIGEAIQINYGSEFRKAVKRFLNKFIKASFQYEKNLMDDPIYYSKYYDVYMDEIIPLMERYDIIKEISNNNSHQNGSRAWALKDYDLSTIFEAEESPQSPLYGFWKEVNTHKKSMN